MKLKLFTDKVGRIILGEELEDQNTKNGIIAIKNPVICNLVDGGQGKPAQLSILPYVFIELFDITKHDDYVAYFNVVDITVVESVGAGEDGNLHANLISNYKGLFERIRMFKQEAANKQQPTKGTNTIEVE